MVFVVALSKAAFKESFGLLSLSLPSLYSDEF